MPTIKTGAFKVFAHTHYPFENAVKKFGHYHYLWKNQGEEDKERISTERRRLHLRRSDSDCCSVFSHLERKPLSGI